MFLQFSPAVKQKKGAKKETNQEQEVLSLAPFTANPKISFENIKIGKTAVRKLIIQNPRNQRAEVTAKITFPEELSMHIDWEEQIIEPNQEVILEVTWTPQSDGVWRVVLHVDGNNVRKKVPLVLKAIKSPKKHCIPKKALPVNKRRTPLKQAPEEMVYGPSRPGTSFQSKISLNPQTVNLNSYQRKRVLSDIDPNLAGRSSFGSPTRLPSFSKKMRLETLEGSGVKKSIEANL